MTGYEKEYQRCEAACGEPFEEFIEFFNAAPAPLSVLDLGCGQGRASSRRKSFGMTRTCWRSCLSRQR